jgi:hypothetical protein
VVGASTSAEEGGAHFGGGGGHWGGGGGAMHFSAAHIGGGHPHFSPHVSSHVSSHVSHWGGGHHYAHVTHYSHPHTTGIHSHSNLSKTNFNKSNLGKSNGTEHGFKNAGQDKNSTGKNLNGKNSNEHVKPLASDPKNFGAWRDFAKKTAFNSFWHDKWHQDRWRHHHFFHVGWIGPWFWPYAYGDFFYFALWPWDYWLHTAMAISTKPFSSPTVMMITSTGRAHPSAWRD